MTHDAADTHTRVTIPLDSFDATDHACRECSTATKGRHSYIAWPCAAERARVSVVLDDMMAESAQYYGVHQ